MGIVNHIGSINRGHYYTEVKVDGVWYEANDETVRPIKFSKMTNESKYVYMLFYEKIN